MRKTKRGQKLFTATGACPFSLGQLKRLNNRWDSPNLFPVLYQDFPHAGYRNDGEDTGQRVARCDEYSTRGCDGLEHSGSRFSIFYPCVMNAVSVWLTSQSNKVLFIMKCSGTSRRRQISCFNPRFYPGISCRYYARLDSTQMSLLRGNFCQAPTIAKEFAAPYMGILVKETWAFEEIEAFRVQSPPSFEVSGAGQVVDNRVYVGANSQTIKSNVISDITNICECRWIIGIVDATSQSRSPCASAYQTNHDGSPSSVAQA